METKEISYYHAIDDPYFIVTPDTNPQEYPWYDDADISDDEPQDEL